MKRIIFLILLTLVLGSSIVEAQFYRRDIKAATVTASDSITAAKIRVTESMSIPAIAVDNLVSITLITDTATVSDTLYAENIGADSITANYIAGTAIVGDLTGDVTGDIAADTVMVGDTLYATNIGADNITAATLITGDVTGDLTGNVTGDVTGDLTGNVTATTLSGTLTGDVTGDLTGDVTGNLTGNVTATTLSGTLTGDVTGDLTGDVSAAIIVASVSTDLGDSAKLGDTWILPHATWTGIFETNGVGDSVEAYSTYRNELSPGTDPVIARTGEGIVTITFGSTVLTTSKTLIWVTGGATTPNSYIVDAKWTSTTVATIYSGTVADGTAADFIGNITVKIEVIP